MSSKTKIVVLKSRNLIWTAVIIVIVILVAILLASALQLDKEQSRSLPNTNQKESSAVSSVGSANVSSDFADHDSLSGPYIPGSYAATLSLGGEPVDIIVCVDKNHINSIRARNLAHSVATLYPLVPSVLQSLEAQILSSQSLQSVTYSDNSQYTASLLLDAISKALEKAVIENERFDN